MPKIVVNVDRCKGCGYCIQACPKHIIRFAETFNVMGYHAAECFDPEQCTGCTFCAVVCPDVAIEVYK